MKDQAKEVIEKTDLKKSHAKASNEPSKLTTKKCRYENSGNCKNKNCPEIHPRKTCQPHSKLGSCPLESSCEHRHPYGVCYDWQKFGACHRGDSCRNRHPLEMSAPANSTIDPFLGQGSPSGAHGDTEGWGVQHSQPSQHSQQSQPSHQQSRHHDQRGMGRW